MSTKHHSKMQSKRQVLNAIHRVVETMARWMYMFIAFLKGPAECQPPIKDEILLHSAVALASRIRNKLVNLMFSYTNYICIQIPMKLAGTSKMTN